MRCTNAVGFVLLVATIAIPLPAHAQNPCGLLADGWYISDVNDLIRIKGKLYSGGSEAKVDCTLPAPGGFFISGGGTPPTREFQDIEYFCPQFSDPFSLVSVQGSESQVVRNGVAKSECAFVGHYAGGSANNCYGYPYGLYVSSVLKADAAGNFRSEKGTLLWNCSASLFVGKFMVIAK